MPTRLIKIKRMDARKPDTKETEGVGLDELNDEGTQGDNSGGLTEASTLDSGDVDGADDKECSDQDNVVDFETPCDTDDDAVYLSGHINVDTVIVNRDLDSVGYHNQESSKTDQTDSSQGHVNVQSVPSSRNELTNSPVNGGTEMSKRSRSSGKSKKDKVSPFKKKDSLPTKEILNPNSPTPLSTDRCDSSLSTMSGDTCRICQCDKCEIQFDSPLVSPCLCAGSLKFIHQACLQKWIKSSDKLSCELCQFEYSMTKKTKSFREWERLDMTPAERRKVICSVTFHIIAITCVVWSLYVLIDRTTEEVEAGTLLWPFWTKLIVVAIGFTGGVVFMYVQCKMYLTLCKKWRMYNKVIIISSISESQREKANQQGILRITAKQAQLEAERPNLTVFNIVNETESV